MPAWITYTLIGAILYTAVGFVDKYNLSENIKDYRGMSIYSAIVGFITGTILWALTGFPILSIRDGGIVIFTGILSIVASAIYFKAMQEDNAIKVILLFQLIPIFVLILSSIFLHERITPLQYAAFFLILLSSLAISSNGNLANIFKIDKSFKLMFVVDLLWAAGQVMFKFVVEAGHFVKVAAYESWGWAIGGLILYVAFKSVRKSFVSTAVSLPKLALLFVFGNEVLYIVSKLFTFWATSLGSVTLVNVLTSSNILITIVLGWLLTLALPKIFKEDLSVKNIVTKCAWALVMFGGVVLISL
jgi:drug/metabolite transporter (DMT)-like permease